MYEKITKYPNLTYLPEKSLPDFFLGGGCGGANAPCPPISYTYDAFDELTDENYTMH